MKRGIVKLIHAGTQAIETKRLILRQFTCDDADDMLKNRISDKQVQADYGEPAYENIDSVKSLLEKWISSYCKDDFYWAIILKENNENIGQIAFCSVDSKHHYADIEYCIGRVFQRNGYATEALSAVIDYTFRNTGMNRLQAFHRGRNVPSGKVLRKACSSHTFWQCSFQPDWQFNCFCPDLSAQQKYI